MAERYSHDVYWVHLDSVYPIVIISDKNDNICMYYIKHYLL